MDEPPRTGRVWDRPVRLIHWALVVLITFSWWSHEDHLDWHRLSGYAIVALLVFRIWWGFTGSSTARFSRFLAGPARIRAYLAGKAAPAIGHNPLGGWSVAAMLAALVVHVTFGMFSVDVDGIESGPLAVFVSFDTGRAFAEAHDISFKVLLGLIVLHLGAIAFYALRGKNLVGPMIGGDARLPDDAEPMTAAPRWSLVVGIGLAAGALALLLWLNRGL